MSGHTGSEALNQACGRQFCLTAHLRELRECGKFEPRNLGVSRLPAGVVRASFTEPNVSDEPALIDRMAKTASRAGMGNVKALSVSLPSGSARSMVVALDAAPTSRAEMEQMIEWKAERGMGQKFGDLRVNYTRLRDMGGRPQYLVSATTERVVAQYERNQVLRTSAHVSQAGV